MLIIDVGGYIKPVKAKEFVVLLPYRRAEAGSNCAVYDILEDFSAMRLGVEVSKLHVRTCVSHLNYFW